MRRCEEEHFGTGIGDAVPGEGENLVRASGAGKLRVEVFQVECGCCLWFSCAAKEGWGGAVKFRVM